MTTVTEYEQALTLIRRLDRPTRARLISQIVQELVIAPPEPPRRSIEAWAQLAKLREEFRQLGSVSPSAAEQLDHDRQHRADLLEGRVRE